MRTAITKMRLRRAARFADTTIFIRIHNYPHPRPQLRYTCSDVDNNTNSFMSANNPRMSIFPTRQHSQIGSTNTRQDNVYFDIVNSEAIVTMIIYKAQVPLANKT